MNILDKYTTLLSGLHLNRHIIPYLYNINVYDDRKSIKHFYLIFMSRAEPASGECHPPSLPVPVLRKIMIAQIFPCQLVVHFHQKFPARKTSSVICGQQGFYIRLKQAVYPILLVQIRFINHLSLASSSSFPERNAS